MRNYRRIYAAGIPCPQPILLKSHVLVMEFLGGQNDDNGGNGEGWPSPRLKDAVLSEKRLRQAYVECILIMRHLYQKCRLVHGDLSEYNLLWHRNQIYVIDVSQSVETDHPSALDFLRKDASNVNDYFKKVGRLPVMTVRQLFEFITTPLLSSTSDEPHDETAAEMAALDSIMNHVQESEAQRSRQTEEGRREAQQQEHVDEAVFMSSFLPRSLNQMAEHDVQQLQDGKVEETYAIAVAALTGNSDVVQAVHAQQQQQQQTTKTNTASMQTVQSMMTKMNYAAENKGVTFVKDVKDSGSPTSDIENKDHSINYSDDRDDDDNDDSDSDASDDDDDEDDDDEEDDAAFGKVARTPEELQLQREAKRAERKANKKAVKETKCDKRKDKIKKKDKKRAIKKSKAGNRKK
jgi:RIO kinase 1